MSAFKISKPGRGNDKRRFVKDAHEDHLIVFIGIEYEPELDTSYGTTDAAKVDTVVCLDCPAVYEDALVIGTVLVPRLTSAENKTALCRLVRGEAKPGRSAPWLPEDPTDHDEKRAEEFAERHFSRLPSGRIVIELPEHDDDEEPF